MLENRILLTTPTFPYPTLPANDSLTDATGLGVTRSALVVALWETMKPFVYASVAAGDDEPMVAPAARPVSVELPAAKSRRPPLAVNEPKVAVRLVLPEVVLTEIGALALADDRSQSWVLRFCYQLGRDRILDALDSAQAPNSSA